MTAVSEPYAEAVVAPTGRTAAASTATDEASAATDAVGIADAVGAADTTDLGSRLRAAREAQRRTLADVADAAELTKGYVSKVERGMATPSVAALVRLCGALGVSIGELFDPGADHDLVRADAYPPIEFGGEGMHESLLTPVRERRLQVIHSVIEPRGGSGQETYELPADVEFVFVVRGRLELTIDAEVQVLGAGDALTFTPHARHSFVNPDDHDDAVVLWVMTPALPIAERAEGHAVSWS